MDKQKSTFPVYINSWAMNSALGNTINLAKQRLTQGFSEDMCSETGWLNDGKATVVGKIKSTLPKIKGRYNTRNNQIALSALQRIEKDVREAINQYSAERIAIIVATSTSGISNGEQALATKYQTGHFPDDYHYQQQELGNLGEFIADYLHVTGPVYTISTACSSSGRIFISAKRLLKSGLVDAVLVGGADSLCKLTLNGFHALEALSTTRCNPFSSNRDGINIGEAGAFMLLSKKNTHNNIALLGVGDSSDAHHISAPHPEGKGAIEAMHKALDDAQLTTTAIGYINAHGTATPLNDAMESKAIYKLFQDTVPVSSTKPFTGHTLGAASILEASICCLILQEKLDLPMHINDGHLDTNLAPIALVKNKISLQKNALLNNSFAFGGNNVSLIFGYDHD